MRGCGGQMTWRRRKRRRGRRLESLWLKTSLHRPRSLLNRWNPKNRPRILFFHYCRCTWIYVDDWKWRQPWFDGKLWLHGPTCCNEVHPWKYRRIWWKSQKGVLLGLSCYANDESTIENVHWTCLKGTQLGTIGLCVRTSLFQKP